MRFLFFAVTALFFASAGWAQNIGVQFDRIAVGTQFHYKNYKGETFVMTYKGRSGKFHMVTETHADVNFSATRRYDSEGHLTRVQFKNGYHIRYSPRRCDRVMGHCKYRYKGNPKFNGLYHSNLVRSGNGFAYAVGRANTEERHDVTVKLGEHNVLAEETWTAGNGKTRFVRLVRTVKP